MALAAGSFTHMPVLPTLKYTSKKSMTITIKCANNKNKTKVYAMKPIVRPGGGLGTDPQSTINRRPIGEPTGSTGSKDLGTDPQSTIDSHDGEPTGSTGSEGLGTDPQMENPQLPTNPPKNSDDDEDQLDNTSAFNLTGNEKCANNNKNKTKVDRKKPIGSTGGGGLGKGPGTTKNQRRKQPMGSTGSGGKGTDAQTENTQIPTNSDDDEDQLDNTFAFNLTSNEWVVVFLPLILFVGSTLFKAH